MTSKGVGVDGNLARCCEREQTRNGSKGGKAKLERLRNNQGRIWDEVYIGHSLKSHLALQPFPVMDMHIPFFVPPKWFLPLSGFFSLDPTPMRSFSRSANRPLGRHDDPLTLIPRKINLGFAVAVAFCLLFVA